MHYLAMVLELAKVRLTAMVTVTAATGYVLAAGRLDRGIWLPVLGTFLLACGAVALNQVQESKLDGRMDRTRNRPIPSGRLDRVSAGFVAAILILLGLFFLASIPSQSMVPLALGGLAVFWYNLVYTPLKRLTPFAVAPGALLGAVGPMIGWAAAGESIRQPLIMLVAGVLLVWQIPHFWLLALMHGGQYASAGLPDPAKILSRSQLARITFTWIAAAASMGLILPAKLLPGGMSVGIAVILSAASVWLVVRAISLLRQDPLNGPSAAYRRAFVTVNIYGLTMLACLALDSLTRVR